MSELVDLFDFRGDFFDFFHQVDVVGVFLRIVRLLRSKTFLPEIFGLIDPELALKPDRKDDFMFVWDFGRIRMWMGDLRIRHRRYFTPKLTNFSFINGIFNQIKLIKINKELRRHKNPQIIFLIHDEKHILITLRLIH